MARNIFADGMDAFDSSYERTGKIYSDVARRKAGTALAGGDRAGAAQALGGNGDVGAVEALQQADAREQDQAFDRDRVTRQDALASQARSAGILKEVAQGLKSVPPGQRKAALQSVYPLFQQSGIDTSHFDPLTEEQLTDQQLDVFTGEVDKHVGVPLGGGGYGDYNQTKHTFTTLREPTQKAPPGFEYDDQGGLAPIPGYVAGRKAISEATRAPPRGRSGGGGGGNHYGATPHGPVVQIDPSQVKWK